MLTVDITYDVTTRLLAITSISTGVDNVYIGTTGDDMSTMIRCTFDGDISGYDTIWAEFDVRVPKNLKKNEYLKPAVQFSPDNTLLIPGYVMSNAIHGDLPMQLALENKVAGTRVVSLNKISFKVADAIDADHAPYSVIIPNPEYVDANIFTMVVGDGINTIFTIPHNLGTPLIDLFCYANTDFKPDIQVAWERASDDVATVTFSEPPDVDGYTVCIFVPGMTDDVLSVNGYTGHVTQEEMGLVTEWQSTPDDTHFPSEKLVKDTFNSEAIRLQGLIDAETSARQAADAAEVTARSEADTALDTKFTRLINTEADTRASKDDELQDNIDAEEQARIDADTTLQDNIDAEETRAKGAEDALDDKIDLEIQNRIDDVDAEETRAKGVESNLNTAIGNEVTRATNRENAIAGDLADEVTARQNADNTLTTNLASEVNTRGLEITRVEGLISAEATAREQADAALSTAIFNEVTRATGAEDGLQTSITALQNNKVDKTFSDSVFVGASITDRTVDGAKITFNKKDTNNDQPGTVAVSLPVASGGVDGYAGLATADQIDQIIKNREDIDLLLGKSTRYAIDVDLSRMTDAQIQAALTSKWRDASGQTTGDPEQYTTLVNLWNNHEYTWLTIVTDSTTDPPTTTTQWEDRGISTVSIATSNSLGVVMGTDPDPVDHTADGTVFVDANGQMQVNGWDDITTDIANAQSDITGLQNTKADKTTTVNGHPLSSNVIVTKGDVGLGNVDNYPTVSAWQTTPDDTHIPSEKLTKDTLDAKLDKSTIQSNTASSLTATAMGSTANRQYAVGYDANGDLSVNVPWQNTMVSQYESSANLRYPILLSAGTGPGSYVDISNKNVSMTGNPSTGVITATGFVGNLTGNVTGNVSGTAGSVAYSNITSNPIPSPVVGTDEGKAIIVNSSGTGFEFGEAGKVDDVRINGNLPANSIVSNKIAVIPITVTDVQIAEVD